MAVVVGLGLLVGMPWLALKGKGRRATYLALTVVGIALGFVAVMLGYSPMPAEADETARRGIEVMHRTFPTLAGWLFALAFGSLLGAILFRPRRA